MKSLTRTLVLALFLNQIDAVQVRQAFAPADVDYGNEPGDEYPQGSLSLVERGGYKGSTLDSLKKLVSKGPSVANIQDRVERLRDLRPRIADAVTQSHQIIKEVQKNADLFEPLSETMSKKEKVSSSKDSDDEDSDDQNQKSTSSSKSIVKALTKATKKQSKSSKDSDSESAIEKVTSALGNMNIQSISSPQPTSKDGESEESTRDMALRALRKTLVKPDGPSVSKLARKAKKQIFGGVAGSVAREMLEEDEKEAEKIAEAELRDVEEVENQKIMKKTLDNDVEDASVTLVKQVAKADEVIRETEKEELQKVHKAKKEQKSEDKKLGKIDKRGDMEIAYDNAKLSIMRTKTLEDDRKAAGVDQDGDELKEEVGAKIARELAEGDKEAADKKKYDKDSKKGDEVLAKKSIKKSQDSNKVTKAIAKGAEEALDKQEPSDAKKEAVAKITQAAKAKISKGSSLTQQESQSLNGGYLENYHIRF